MIRTKTMHPLSELGLHGASSRALSQTMPQHQILLTIWQVVIKQEQQRDRSHCIEQKYWKFNMISLFAQIH
jgi:hypothetical protein